MIEVIGTISTLLAIAGVILNNHRLWPCFVLWVISNALTGYIHYRKRVWSLFIRDVVFVLLAIQGLWLWTR